MNSSQKTLLMFFSGDALSLILTGLIMVGGILVMIGKPQKGFALVLGALSLPFILLFKETLRNELLLALPEGLRGPVSFIFAGIIGIVLLLAVARMLLGKEIYAMTVSQTIGTLLADLIRWTLTRIFTRAGCLVLLASGGCVSALAVMLR
jgi:hypothetical protein